MYSELIFPFLCQVQGRSHNGLRREGVLRPEISKKGVLRVQKRCRYMPERRFVRVLVKMTKKFGPMGGGEVLTPISPPLGYAPVLILL